MTSRITPDSYEKRIQEYDKDFPWGECAYRPPVRTPEEIASRTIDIEEHIAIRLLSNYDKNGFTRSDVEGYIVSIINDVNYAQTLYDVGMKIPDYDDFNDNYFNEDDNIRCNRYACDINRAQLYLASAIVRHRLTGYSGSIQTTNLGFGINVSESLASEIVDYHNRIKHAIHNSY